MDNRTTNILLVALLGVMLVVGGFIAFGVMSDRQDTRERRASCAASLMIDVGLSPAEAMARCRAA